MFLGNQGSISPCQSFMVCAHTCLGMCVCLYVYTQVCVYECVRKREKDFQAIIQSSLVHRILVFYLYFKSGLFRAVSTTKVIT